jgi:hypothetical protein
MYFSKIRPKILAALTSLILGTHEVPFDLFFLGF